MPIQIIDNFELNSPKALDNRLVVGPGQFYLNKESLPHKYSGMRVWDLNVNIPYVWTGVTFSTETAGSISGSGTTNYIAKFVSPGNFIQNSLIFDNSTNVGISTATPDKKLTVAGDIKSTGVGGFFGIGTFITNMNASNITSGTLQLTRLENGSSSGRILVSGGSQPSWSDQIQIGSAPNTVPNIGTVESSIYFRNPYFGPSNGVKIYSTNQVADSYSPDSVNMVFKIGTSEIMRLSDGGFEIKSPSVGYITTSTGLQLNTKTYIVDGNATSPSISFLSDTNTGIYRTGADQIGFTTGGSNRLNISNTIIKSTIRFDLPTGSAASPSLTFGDISLNSGIYRSSNVIYVSIQGVNKFSVSGSIVNTYVSLGLPAGSPSTPSLTFGDVDSGIYKSGTKEISISSEGSYMMTVKKEGISAFNDDIISLSSFTISPGTALLTTGLTITSEPFDRIIYVTSNRIDNAFYITGGFFDVNIVLIATSGSKNIYTFSCEFNSPKSFHVNYSFILPAGRTARVEYTKDSLTFSSGSGIQINTRYTQLGRTIYGII